MLDVDEIVVGNKRREDCCCDLLGIQVIALKNALGGVDANYATVFAELN